MPVHRRRAGSSLFLKTGMGKKTGIDEVWLRLEVARRRETTERGSLGEEEDGWGCRLGSG